MAIATITNKKFLDSQGLTYLAQKLNDYPDNTVLAAVIEGIQDALDEKVDTSKVGMSNGVASLDSSGKIPVSQLPQTSSDILIYPSLTDLPSQGADGKLYVLTQAKKILVWGGNGYTEITFPLGTTSDTAFRGDYGQTAYTHAVTNKGNAYQSGFYKIATNSEGHVISATLVTKADIMALGIPGSSSGTGGGGGTTVIQDRLFLWALTPEEESYYLDLYARAIMNEYRDVMYDEIGNPIYVDASNTYFDQSVMNENGEALYTEDNQILQLG